MKKILMLVLFAMTSTISYGQKIYQAHSADDAQVLVYPADDPSEADLLVCFVWDESEITRTGLWMDMRTPQEASVIILFVDEENEADLKIWLVDTPAESKWLNESKKNLLQLK